MKQNKSAEELQQFTFSSASHFFSLFQVISKEWLIFQFGALFPSNLGKPSIQKIPPFIKGVPSVAQKVSRLGTSGQ